MPRWFRRILFWFFVALFLTLAPLLVFYTAGYRYSFSSGLVSRTGVLSITTNPRNVDIYLDGAYTQTKTPEVLKRIMPGNYELELRKDGYRPWTGSVKIESGLTEQLQDVSLFLDRQPELLFNKKTELLRVNPGDASIAYLVQEAGWQEIWLYNPSDNSHALLEQTLDKGHEVDLSWSTQGAYLLVFDQTDGDCRFFSNKTKEQINDHTDVINAQWNPSTDQRVSLTTSDGLIQMDLASGSIEMFAQTDETSVLLDASVLRLIQGDNYTEVAQYVADKKETLALLPKGSYTIEERDGTYLLLTDQIGDLYLIKIHETQPILLKANASSYDWDANLDRLVYSNGFELSVYEARTHSNQLITRQSDGILSVHWHPSVDIIFVQDSNLRAFEVYAQAEQRFTTTLLENTTIDALWIAKDGTTAYFYGQRDGASGVYALPISEKQTFQY